MSEGMAVGTTQAVVSALTLTERMGGEQVKAELVRLRQENAQLRRLVHRLCDAYLWATEEATNRMELRAESKPKAARRPAAPLARLYRFWGLGIFHFTAALVRLRM